MSRRARCRHNGRLNAFIRKDRGFRWTIVWRGSWVHCVDSLRDYVRSAERFTMDGRAELIRCPTLLTIAEDDSLGCKDSIFSGNLECPKTLFGFSAAEGARDLFLKRVSRKVFRVKIIGKRGARARVSSDNAFTPTARANPARRGSLEADRLPQPVIRGTRKPSSRCGPQCGSYRAESRAAFREAGYSAIRVETPNRPSAGGGIGGSLICAILPHNAQRK